jgi:amidase
MFVADGGKSVRALLEPTEEPFRPEMAVYQTATELGTHDMWQLHLDRTELQREFLDQWISYEGLDAILCRSRQPLLSILAYRVLGPSTPYASVEHGGFKYVGYTGVFNVVDYSAVSFPCGVIVDKAKDRVPPDYAPLSEICEDIQSNCG